MRQFFAAEYNGASFTMFSPLHNKTLLIILMVNLIIFMFLKWNNKQKTKRYFRIGLALILILGELALIIWHWGIGEFSLATSLPLHLCRISALLAAVMLLTKSEKIYQIVYFIGLGAAIPALISPDISVYNFPHFAFFKFFINHSGIVTAISYMTIIEGYQPQFKSILKSLVGMNLYLPLIAFINLEVGGNYLYIMHKPPSPSLMDYLGSWPWYILNLELVALVLFLIYYSPFFLFKHLNNLNWSIIDSENGKDLES